MPNNQHTMQQGTGDATPQCESFYDMLMAGMLLLEQRFFNLDQDRS